MSMLSDDAINKLVQPIADRQEKINTFVISTIATKVREIGELSPSDINKLKILTSVGADIKQINAELAKLSNVQIRDIKTIIRNVAIDSHLDAKPLYDYRHKSFIPYEKNAKLQQLVNAIGNITANEYTNLSNSKAVGFLIRDFQNPTKLKFQSIGATYKSIIDEAIQASVSNVLDYRVAIRRALKQLANSGIRRIYWDSGYTQRLDTAVRRNVLEGIRAIQQAIEDENGKRINATGKELSVHANCALDHEPFQGHQFTNEEFDKLQSNEDFIDVDNVHFAAVDRVIGQFNCRHIAKSIIVGVSKPRYTQKQLTEIIKKNHEGYILPNGKRISLYECTQLQRQMETKIRYAKDEQIVMQKAGDIKAAKLARQKVLKYAKEYQIFSKNCGLPMSKDRIEVTGYRAIKVS